MYADGEDHAQDGVFSLFFVPSRLHLRAPLVSLQAMDVALSTPTTKSIHG